MSEWIAQNELVISIVDIPRLNASILPPDVSESVNVVCVLSVSVEARGNTDRERFGAC